MKLNFRNLLILISAIACTLCLQLLNAQRVPINNILASESLLIDSSRYVRNVPLNDSISVLRFKNGDSLCVRNYDYPFEFNGDIDLIQWSDSILFRIIFFDIDSSLISYRTSGIALYKYNIEKGTFFRFTEAFIDFKQGDYGQSTPSELTFTYYKRIGNGIFYSLECINDNILLVSYGEVVFGRIRYRLVQLKNNKIQIYNLLTTSPDTFDFSYTNFLKYHRKNSTK